MAEKDEKPEEKLIIVGEGGQDEVSEPVQKEEKPVEKEATNETTSEIEATDEDERTGHAEEDEATEEGREAIRERRRQERKNRRERDARLRREVNFLRNRNEQLERRFSEVAARQDQVEGLSIDQRISQTESQIRQAEEIHGKAITSNDGSTATEALRIKDALSENLQSLKGLKAEREKSRESSTVTESQARRPPEAVISWVKSNEWFDPSLRDETSHLVKVMEDRLASEGEYTADQPEYWEELNRRIDNRFPSLRRKKATKSTRDEVFDEDDDDEDRSIRKEPSKAKKGSGPRFSVGGQTRSLKPNEVFINAERRKALEEAGVWDNEEERNRYLKAYQRYDAEARKNS